MSLKCATFRVAALATLALVFALTLTAPLAHAVCSHPADNPDWAFVFRCADVYKENPFTSVQSRLLAVQHPGDHLNSDYVSIYPYINPLATSQPSTEFTFAPFGTDSASFSQVNTFYHGYRFVEKLASYGFDYGSHTIVYNVTNPPSGTSSTNIQGVGPGEPVYVYLGGPGGRSDGKDADIVVHETTHAALNFLIPVASYPIDAQAVYGAGWEWHALAEGLADYYASAVNGNTVVGEYSAAPTGGYYDINTSASTFKYDNVFVMGGDFYFAGRVFNGALVGLRATYGAVIDELVFAATWFITDGCYKCYYDAIRSADIALYEGVHLSALEAAFTTSRHIPASVPYSAIDGPESAVPSSSVSVSVGTRCGVAPFTYAWESRPHGSATWSSTGLTGADVVLTMPNADTDLRVQVTDALSGVTQSEVKTVTVASPSRNAVNALAVAIAGPPRGTTGRADEYRVVWKSASQGPTRVTWELESNGVTTPLGSKASPLHSRTGASAIRVRVDPRPTPSILRVRVEEPNGRVATASLAIKGSVNPSIQLEGPEYLAADEFADYKAVITGGVPPFAVRWVQESDGEIRGIGEGLSMHNATTAGPFRISATVKDADGRIASTQMVVGRQNASTSGFALSSAAALAFRASPTIVGSGQSVTFTLDHVRGPFTLSLYDVAGRQVWTQRGEGGGGSATASWVAGKVAPGLLFARCEATGQAPRTVPIIVR